MAGSHRQADVAYAAIKAAQATCDGTGTARIGRTNGIGFGSISGLRDGTGRSRGVGRNNGNAAGTGAGRGQGMGMHR